MDFVKRSVTRSLEHFSDHGAARHLVRSFSLSGEARLVSVAKFMVERVEFFRGFIPHTDLDTVVYEMQLNHGRADIVFFHLDGSITVVEAKDGAAGYRSVVAGIGQVGYYATMLGSRGTDMRVRRALLWDSTGDASEDARIAEACEMSGVIPMRMERAQNVQERFVRVMIDEANKDADERQRRVMAALPASDIELLRRFGLIEA